MKIEKYKSLNKSLIKEIEIFLNNGESILNPLYSSPAWAIRLSRNFKFNYTFYIVRNSEKISAILLIFKGYRGYQRIRKLPRLIKKLFIYLCKNFFGYHIWFNGIIFLKDENKKNKILIKKLIYNNLNKYKKIYRSPIWNGDNYFFPKLNYLLWGTFIIETNNRSYSSIFSNYKRNAKRTISKEKNIKVSEINKNNLDKYLNWVRDNQRVTGKSNVIIKDDFLYDLNFLNKRNYIYKIFIACDEKGILGSISIWGFANVISERGVYRSKFAKKNNKHDQDILKDWILRFAINNKIIHFDLAGFNPNKSLSNKENNIKRFKEKFGGKKYIYQNINS